MRCTTDRSRQNLETTLKTLQGAAIDVCCLLVRVVHVYVCMVRVRFMLSRLCNCVYLHMCMRCALLDEKYVRIVVMCTKPDVDCVDGVVCIEHVLGRWWVLTLRVLGTLYLEVCCACIGKLIPISIIIFSVVKTSACTVLIRRSKEHCACSCIRIYLHHTCAQARARIQLLCIKLYNHIYIIIIYIYIFAKI